MKYLFIIFLTPLFLQSQWTTSSGSSKFDGNYRSASIVGKGGEWPFTKPMLVLNRFDNNSPSLYLTNIGYTGCDDNEVYFSFDGTDDIYESSIVSTNKDEDAVFINGFDNISMVEIISLLKSKNTVFVRYENNCGQEDYQFSLKGSSKAINYVAGTYYEIKMSLMKESKRIEEEKELVEAEELKKIRERLHNSITKEADEMQIMGARVLFHNSLVMFNTLNKPIPVELKSRDSIFVINKSRDENKILLRVKRINEENESYYVTIPQFERLYDYISLPNEWEYVMSNWSTIMKNRNRD